MRVLKPSIRETGTQVASAQAGTPQFIMGQASARRRSPIWPRARRISSFYENVVMLPHGTICS